MTGYVIAYCGRKRGEGDIVTRFTPQHPTLYASKRSAMNFIRRNHDTLRKPVAILRRLDDRRWLVEEVIE